LSEKLHIKKPLRYTLHCAGCKAEIEICPAELDDRLAVCPHCRMPNSTPIFALLSGRRKAPEPDA
jgi:rRNA maturation endonuclease Nob1